MRLVTGNVSSTSMWLFPSSVSKGSPSISAGAVKFIFLFETSVVEINERGRTGRIQIQEKSVVAGVMCGCW